MLPHSFIADLLQTIADAPFFIDSSIKSCPSKLSPLIAMNRSPFLTSLLSILMLLIKASSPYKLEDRNFDIFVNLTSILTY